MKLRELLNNRLVVAVLSSALSAAGIWLQSQFAGLYNSFCGL